MFVAITTTFVYFVRKLIAVVNIVGLTVVVVVVVVMFKFLHLAEIRSHERLLALVLLPHYLAKCRRRSLGVYKNQFNFILGSGQSKTSAFCKVV